MFDPDKVSRLSIPQWEGVYRADIHPKAYAIIAVHDTSRGWALGGCRMAQYDNEALALTDALRLSRGMTFKNAVANLPLGGGKSVLICDPKVEGEERDQILEEFGKFVAWVNREEDRYYTAEDMNTTVADMHAVAKHTKNIHGTKVDPSPYTAWGVFCAIEFAVDYFAPDLFDGEKGLSGKKVLVQGLGKVGMTILEDLHQAGAKLMISDIRQESIDRALEKYPNAEVVPADKVLDVEVDVFAPCAKGEVVTRRNVDQVKCKILCGAANNILQNTDVGDDLQKRGIVYCPDYVANMGGVCSIQYLEIEELSVDKTRELIRTTVRKMLGQTFRTGFSQNLAFNKAVSQVVKHMVWGSPEPNTSYNSSKLFPLASAAEPIE